MVVVRRVGTGSCGCVGVLLRRAGHVARVAGRGDEIVAVPHRPVRHVVDHQDLVGHEEHQVALVGRALQLELHRLELVGEVVAEGAVEAEVLVLVVAEELDHRAQQAEDRGLPAALFLGHDLHRRVDLPAQAIAVRFQRGDRRERLDGGADRLQQHPAPGLQRRDLEVAPAASDGERRGGEAQVPARVAAGKLEAGRHEDAGKAVQTLDQGRGRRADRRLAVAAVDGDAAASAVAAVAGGGFAHGALMPLAATPLSSDAGNSEPAQLNDGIRTARAPLALPARTLDVLFRRCCCRPFRNGFTHKWVSFHVNTRDIEAAFRVRRDGKRGSGRYNRDWPFLPLAGSSCRSPPARVAPGRRHHAAPSRKRAQSLKYCAA